MKRRNFLTGAAATAVLPWLKAAEASPKTHYLRASASSQQIVPEDYPQTAVWCYDHSLPGPELRVRQGDRVRVLVENALDEDTTVHWHGIRLENAMDGVPHLTQEPIEPGQRFLYEFEARDAGTFWYHPHQRSFEQVGRGLSGSLVVEETDPIRVDRDVTWVLDDWVLERSAQLSDSFGNMHDISHAGRTGNTVTINGQIPESFRVKTGERIRLRLVNAANARIFGLDFQEHQPQIIAIDGHPVSPHPPTDNQVVLAPGMRVDIILDCGNNPGSSSTVVDNFTPSRAYRLVDIRYGSEALRNEPPVDSIQLNPNNLPEPNLVDARKVQVNLAGGARGTMEGAIMDGRWQDIRSMVHAGKAWAINGVTATGHVMDPLIALSLGESCILDMKNDSAWHHPMHLHGHAFRVLSRNGVPTRHREWQDTVLLAPDERVEIGFVADNPGNWMFHCHILEHQAGGMMGVVRVS